MSEKAFKTEFNRFRTRMDPRKWLNPRKWLTVVAVITALALLSAAQIYLREKAAGQSPAWFRTVATNLLAWSPWIFLTAAIFRFGGWVPLVGGRWPRSVPIHLVAATLTAIIYLVYLTYFWFVFFPELMPPLAPTSYLLALGKMLGEFFLMAFVGYWLILAVGFAMETSRRTRVSEEEFAPGEAAKEGQQQDEPDRLEIRSRGRVRYVDVPAIDWLEAEGSYVRLHLGASSLLHRRALSSLIKELGESFVRIHRGAAVRLDRVAELRPVSHGEAILRLNTGRELKVSRSYRRQVEPLLRSSGSLHGGTGS